MALERRDPVPAGRYYIFIKADESDAWAGWVEQYADRVKPIAIESQSISPDSPIWATTPTGSIVKEHVGDWILFDVTAPVPWVKLGLPTIVTDPSVRSTVDVYQAPVIDTENGPLDELASMIHLLTVLAGIGGVIVLGSVVVEGVKATRRYSK